MCISYHSREVANLNSVRSTGRVLKEAIIGIEEKPRQFEEKFPLGTTVVQPTCQRWLKNEWLEFLSNSSHSSPFLSVPVSIQSPPPQILSGGAHDELICIGQEGLPTKAGILSLVRITIATLLQLTLQLPKLFNEFLLLTLS